LRHQSAWIEIAGVEIVAHAEGMDGKRGRNEYGKPKFQFSNIVVQSTIGSVCPSELQQPIELNVIQNDVTHLYILCAECLLLLNTHLNAQCVAC